MKYDFLIVGAGLFGSTFAHLANRDGYKCLVMDKRGHVAGNCYTQNTDGINVHQYGPHIFHTNSAEIWKFINQFGRFNNYVHTAKSSYNGQVYSFPINLMTFNQLYGIQTPLEAKHYLETVRIKNDDPKNLEEWILDKVGMDLYSKFIEGYTAKQWNKHPRDLPASIIKRLPIRLTYNDRYFLDDYQGIPVDGYTNLIFNMLEGSDVILYSDYLTRRDEWDKIAHRIVYTGPIDDFFNCKFGKLEWRSLRFEFQHLTGTDFQGTSVVNYSQQITPFTRIVEYKHFDQLTTENTVICREYPQNYSEGEDKYYPINTPQNTAILHKYTSLIDNTKFIFGGRLAEYKYYDMHQIIASAMHKYKSNGG